MPKLNNVIFLGRKPLAHRAAENLLATGINIKLIVAPEKEDYRPNLRELAAKHKILVLNDMQVYRLINSNDKSVENIDLVISYLFWKKIKMPLIKLGKRGCINFHPAPLPDYKSRAGYNTAIIEKKDFFGASVHFVDSEDFDSGPIIKVKKFSINPKEETVISLEKKTQTMLFKLFKETIKLFLTENKIKTSENKGGLYLSTRQLEELKLIDQENDSLEEIRRKIRAFFFPPYQGAKINIKGQDFTIVDDETLEYIHKLIIDRE